MQIQLLSNILNPHVPTLMHEELRGLERTSAKACNKRTRNRRRVARLGDDVDLCIDNYYGFDNDDDNNRNGLLTVCLAVNYRTSFTPWISRLFGVREDQHWSRGMTRGPCKVGTQGFVVTTAAGEVREGLGTLEEGAYRQLST